ncbi:TPA: Ig-like domain-containing protein [Pluralibacter gergoviae]
MSSKDLSLSPPRIPAADDGVIDKNDISSSSIIAIIGYSGRRLGDFIKLYIDNNEVGSAVAPDDITLPVIIPIKSALLTDGSHSVGYDATDPAGNTRFSEDLNVYVDRLHDVEKLTPPSVIGGDDGCLSQSEITSADGAVIRIHPSVRLNNFRGDILHLFWKAFDAAGLPLTSASRQWSYTIDETLASEGATFFITLDIVNQALNGRVSVYFYIQTGAERLYSDARMVAIGNCESGRYTIALVSDKSEVMANDADFATLTATVIDSDSKPVSAQHVHWSSDLNTLNRDDTFTSADGTTNNTLKGKLPGLTAVTATIENGDAAALNINFVSGGNMLPAPVFLQATDSEIRQADIIADGGVRVRVAYEGMSTADSITLFFSGQDSSGSTVNGTADEQTHILTAADVARRAIDFVIAEEKAVRVGNGGQLSAFYRVVNGAQTRFSGTAKAQLIVEAAENLLGFFATAAPVYDRDHLGISSYNYAKVVGQPGIRVSISCSSNAVVVESNSPTWDSQLDDRGILYFRVRAAEAATATINIYQKEHPANSFTGTMQFNNYYVGENAIYAYGYTTGAVADNYMPCSLYFVGTDDITELRLWLPENKAEIVGFDNPAIIPLNTFGAVAVDIISSFAGNVPVQISAPQSPESHMRIELEFLAADFAGCMSGKCKTI